MDAIIRFENVHYTYPGDELESLCGIDLEIEKGSFVAVLGHNGSGKSTLAKHMNAILVPDEGHVTVCGIDTAEEERVIDVRRNVGMVFQNPDNQIVANVVEDDVAFAPENLGVAPEDPQGRREVISTVTRLCREKGMTVVLITHHMDECVGADRLIIMSNGSIVSDGTPEKVFADAALMEREGLTVPETTRLLHDLRKAGFELDTEALGVDACAREIAAALKH